jgi:hypothetical protein
VVAFYYYLETLGEFHHFGSVRSKILKIEKHYHKTFLRGLMTLKNMYRKKRNNPAFVVAGNQTRDLRFCVKLTYHYTMKSSVTK